MILALCIGTPPSSHFIYIPVIFILGIVIVTAAAVVIANIVVDIAYSLLDPRVRLT